MTTLSCLLNLPPSELAVSHSPDFVYYESEDYFFGRFGAACDERRFWVHLHMFPEFFLPWNLRVVVYQLKNGRPTLLTCHSITLDFLSSQVYLCGLSIMSIPDYQHIAGLQLGFTYGPLTGRPEFAPHKDYLKPPRAPQTGWYGRATPDLQSAYKLSPTEGPFKTKKEAIIASLNSAMKMYPNSKVVKSTTGLHLFDDSQDVRRMFTFCSENGIPDGHPVRFRLIVRYQDVAFDLDTGSSDFALPPKPIGSIQTLYGNYAEGYYEPSLRGSLPIAFGSAKRPRDFGLLFYFNFGGVSKIPVLNYVKDVSDSTGEKLLYSDELAFSFSYPSKNNPSFTVFSEPSQGLVLVRGVNGVTDAIKDQDGEVISLTIPVRAYKLSVCVEMSWDNQFRYDENGDLVLHKLAGSKEFCSPVPDYILPSTSTSPVVVPNNDGNWVYTIWNVCFFEPSKDPGSDGTTDPDTIPGSWDTGSKPVPPPGYVARFYLIRKVEVPGNGSSQPTANIIVNAADAALQLFQYGGLLFRQAFFSGTGVGCGFSFKITFIPNP